VVEDVPWRTILLVGTGVALATTVGQWTVTTGIGPWMRPVGFAVIAAGILAGRPAKWGVAAGLLLTGVLTTGWSTGVTWAVAGFVTASISTRLWARDDGERDESWSAWAFRYGVVVMSGVLMFAATSAWLFDVLGRAAFSVTVGWTVATNLPMAVLGAPFIRLALEYVGEGERGLRASPTPRIRAAVVLIVLGWTVGGYVGGFLFRVVELVSRGGIAERLGPAVEGFITIWGWQGTHAQLLLGIVSLTMIELLLKR
jgi:hypothetical protein